MYQLHYVPRNANAAEVETGLGREQCGDPGRIVRRRHLDKIGATTSKRLATSRRRSMGIGSIFHERAKRPRRS
jgi:hypothetical protein